MTIAKRSSPHVTKMEEMDSDEETFFVGEESRPQLPMKKKKRRKSLAIKSD
jgi:hypothetical protein